MGRMRRFLFAGAILVPALVLFSSCGDDGDDDTPKSGGTDEEYLAAICKGTSDFSNALLTKTTAAEIGDVIEDFITLMKDANPPADLADYNQEFVKYLEDALADPTSLVTREPPLPPDDIQRRLAAKELSVDECKDGTFFSRGLEE
jgi:hypothetical protein